MPEGAGLVSVLAGKGDCVPIPPGVPDAKLMPVLGLGAKEEPLKLLLAVLGEAPGGDAGPLTVFAPGEGELRAAGSEPAALALAGDAVAVPAVVMGVLALGGG